LFVIVKAEKQDRSFPDSGQSEHCLHAMTWRTLSANRKAIYKSMDYGTLCFAVKFRWLRGKKRGWKIPENKGFNCTKKENVSTQYMTETHQNYI
jgi:hypothetical protein